MNKITIYILFNGRENYLLEMLESLLINKINSQQIIISDNSKNNHNCIFLRNIQINYKNIIYKKRVNINSIWDHINICVTECQTKYISILHDDDIIMQNYFKIGLERLEKDFSLTCYCPNALIIRNNKITIQKLRESTSNLIINSSESLLNQYFNINKKGINPFPAYIYRLESLRNISIKNDKFGKYSDIFILIQLLDIGPIYWDGNIYFGYRIHSNNISKFESLSDRLKLLSYIKSINNKDILVKYRISLISNLRSSFYVNKKYYFNIYTSLLFNNPIYLLSYIMYILRKYIIKAYYNKF